MEDDDYPITHSPLEREVTRDGITVEICIYRGDTEPGWILEIVDERGGSTVWEELPTDQEALDLAMKTIDEEGIASFAEAMKNDVDAPSRKLPLNDAELGELKRALGERSIDCALGVLAAVVSLPEMLPSQQWLGELIGGGKLASLHEAQRVAGHIMTLNNFVAKSLMDEDPEAFCPDHDDDQACREFCDGYIEMVNRAEIDPGDDSETAQLLGALGGLARLSDAELMKELGSAEDVTKFKTSVRESLPEYVASLHSIWLEERKPKMPTTFRREQPKIGRNDPCACGSGKKFKKCHGAGVH